MFKSFLIYYFQYVIKSDIEKYKIHQTSMEWIMFKTGHE